MAQPIVAKSSKQSAKKQVQHQLCPLFGLVRNYLKDHWPARDTIPHLIILNSVRWSLSPTTTDSSTFSRYWDVFYDWSPVDCSTSSLGYQVHAKVISNHTLTGYNKENYECFHNWRSKKKKTKNCICIFKKWFIDSAFCLRFSKTQVFPRMFWSYGPKH